MSRWKKRALWLGGALLLAFGVVASGLIPVWASAPHPEPFRSILSFAKHRSVATHSLLVEAPDDLDDEALVLRGAGHYEQACRFCHGTPWHRPPWARDALSPPPPELGAISEHYSAEELYLVVNHGIVFTAMPAWPSRERYDEPWAVVAFLRHLPELEAEDYRELVEVPLPEDAAIPDVVRQRCVGCHGVDGLGRGGAAPVIAGQRRSVLRAALRAYALGDRHSGFMAIPTADLADAQIEEAASYYAQLPGLGPSGEPPGGDGARIAREGLPEEHIPACAGCHGPADHEHAEAYPVLAGQEADFLELQLRLFAEDRRGGSAHAELMEPVASHRLGAAERAAVAAFYEALGDPATRAEAAAAAAASEAPEAAAASEAPAATEAAEASAAPEADDAPAATDASEARE